MRQNTNSGYSLRTHAHMHGAAEREKGGGRRERAKTGRINEEGGGEGSIRLKAWLLQSQREVRDQFLGGRSPLRLSPRLGGPPSERVGDSKKEDGQIASEVPAAECRLHGRLSKSLVVVVYPPVLGMHFTRAPLHVAGQ